MSRWVSVWRCENCGEIWEFEMDEIPAFLFCPRCGRRMKYERRLGEYE